MAKSVYLFYGYDYLVFVGKVSEDLKAQIMQGELTLIRLEKFFIIDLVSI